MTFALENSSQIKCDPVDFYLSWTALQNFQKCVKNCLDIVKFQNNFGNPITLVTALQSALSNGECLMKCLNEIAIDNGFLARKSKSEKLNTTGNKRVVSVKKSFSINSTEKIQLDLDFKSDDNQAVIDLSKAESMQKCSSSRQICKEESKALDEKAVKSANQQLERTNEMNSSANLGLKFWFDAQDTRIPINHKLKLIESKLSQCTSFYKLTPVECEKEVNLLCKSFSSLSIKV